jgi:hypothetical protein
LLFRRFVAKLSCILLDTLIITILFAVTYVGYGAYGEDPFLPRNQILIRIKEVVRMKRHCFFVSLLACASLAIPAYADPIVIGASKSAEIPITSLPATITVPGKYYFVANMYEPTPEWPTAITVNAPGAVVIDMRGFTLTGPEGYDISSIGFLIQGNDVTIENGTIEGFMYQVQAGNPPYPPVPVAGISLLHLFFAATGEAAITFQAVNSSVVKDCVFNFVSTGFSGTPGPLIRDAGSTTGNSYINDRFLGKSFSSSADTSLCAITSIPSSYTVNIVPTKTVSEPPTN